jgi:hypothetical protein
MGLLLNFLSILKSAFDNSQDLASVIGTTVYQLLDEIGDVHTEAARKAIKDKDINSAVANLYPAYVAYEKSMNKSELKRFLTSWTEDTRMTPAIKLVQVCLLMGTCLSHKRAYEKVELYKGKALDAFFVYRGCAMEGYFASLSAHNLKGSIKPFDPTSTLDDEQNLLEQNFYILGKPF